MDTFAVVDPGLDWAPLYLVLLVAGIVALAGVGFQIAELEFLGGFFLLLGVVGGVFFGIFTGAGLATQYEHAVTQEKEAGIESLGYDNVDLKGEFFTASDEDGKYVHGVLVDLGENEYTVLETKGATK